MNNHKNARLTVHGRALIAKRVLHEGWSAKAAADAAGVSRRTAYKWLSRWREGGEAAMQTRPSTARRRPHALPEDRTQLILRLRREGRMTARRIAGELAMPRSTVSAVLARCGLGRLKGLAPPGPVRRYERDRPGDLIHLDIKKLGRFSKPGHRVTGTRQGTRNLKAGWDFVHVCIDDHSRTAYVEVLPDETGRSATAFLARAVRWFNLRGVTVKRVMTDNGSCYTSRLFAESCTALKVRHIRTRPYTPQTNGKAERLIQTLLREWAYAATYSSSRERNARLPQWVRLYNHERPHGSLGHKPPVSRLTAAP